MAAVLQGYGPGVCAADLAEAAYAVEDGAVWVATNTDATLPTDRGTAPGNGTLVGAVERAVGRPPDEVAGKPSPPLYLMCAQRHDAGPETVLAVGDRLETDIEGAGAAGMDSALVLTGVHGLRDALLAPPPRRPTYLLPDLRQLAEPLSPGRVEDGWGVAGAGDGGSARPAGRPTARAATWRTSSPASTPGMPRSMPVPSPRRISPRWRASPRS